MRFPYVIPLFVATTIAVDFSATVLNFLYYQPTLTLLRADPTATTYKNACPNGAYGITALPPDLQPTPLPSSFIPRALPQITPAPLLRRIQSTASASSQSLCEYYLLTQAPSSWGMTLQDPVPGVLTMSAACSWTGALTEAALTCTESYNGWLAESWGMSGVSTATLDRVEVERGGVVRGVSVFTEGVGEVTVTGSATSKVATRTGGGAGEGTTGVATASVGMGGAAVERVPAGVVMVAGAVLGAVLAL